MRTPSNAHYDEVSPSDLKDIRFRMFVVWLADHNLSLSSFEGGDSSVIIFEVSDGLHTYTIRVSESRVLGITCWGILDRLWGVIAELFRIKEW